MPPPPSDAYTELPASEPVTPIDRFKRSVSAIQRELGILGTLKTAAIDARLAVERNLDVVAMGTRSHSAPDVRSLLSGPAIGVAHALACSIPSTQIPKTVIYRSLQRLRVGRKQQRI